MSEMNKEKAMTQHEKETHRKVIETLMGKSIEKYDEAFKNLAKAPGDEPEWSEDADAVAQ